MAKRAQNGGAGESDGTAPQRLLENYLTEFMAIWATGAAVPEMSYYPALSNLFNAVGNTLKPKVRCVIHLSNQGAGISASTWVTLVEQHRRPPWEGGFL